jgi:hypothetical protein
MEVSENGGTPKSSILTGFSIIDYRPCILGTPYLWKPPYDVGKLQKNSLTLAELTSGVSAQGTSGACEALTSVTNQQKHSFFRPGELCQF